MFSAIITALLFGAVVGALGRLFVAGKQDMSWTATVVIGVVAALIGTGIAAALGVRHTAGINWIQHILQILVAAVFVSAYARRPRAFKR